MASRNSRLRVRLVVLLRPRLLRFMRVRAGSQGADPGGRLEDCRRRFVKFLLPSIKGAGVKAMLKKSPLLLQPG